MNTIMQAVFGLSFIGLGCALIFRNTDMIMTMSGISILSYTINVFTEYYGRGE